MATEMVPVTPAVLRWARESIGVTPEVAAARAGVTVERLIGWEEGRGEPTLAKLRELGKLYQRPLSVFLLPEPPKLFDALRDFRRLPGTTDHTWSRALHKVYRRALDQQETAVELLEEAPEAPTAQLPAFKVDDDTEVAGEKARAHLGVTLSTQFGWRNPEAAFNGWLEAVEAAGVFVLRTSDVDPKEMRGFSLPGAVPVIVINALDWPRGQVFSLMHEFSHLMLREGGLCDLLEPDTTAGRRIETWCNAVAAAILMPRGPFVEETAVQDREQAPAEDVAEELWSDASLSQLSQRWGVSQEAVARRLVTLNQAPLSFYRTKREQYLALWTEEREEERRARRQKKPGGGPPPYRMAIRDRGRPYVRLVLDAYYREVLTDSTVSNLLSLKLKHLADLQREAGA